MQNPLSTAAKNAHNNHHHNPKPCKPQPVIPTSLIVIPAQAGNHRPWGNNKTTPTIIPLSLDGRGIKGEGDSKTVPSTCHSEQSRVIPSKARNLKSPTHIYLVPSYWLEGSIHKTMQCIVPILKILIIPRIVIPAYAGIHRAGTAGHDASRHCGLDPQSRGTGCAGQQQGQHNLCPPLP